MMAEVFKSALARDLETFLSFKRSMGFTYKTSGHYLKVFDRFCLEQGASRLTRELVEEWVLAYMETVPSDYMSWVCPIREFARYMRANGDPDAYVLSDRFKTKNRRPMTYLLSEEEIGEFFGACAKIDMRLKDLRRTLLCALFQTLHALGLRCCEARRLPCSDVDLAAGTMDIIWSKGPRSRRLYLSDELLGYLRAYDEKLAFYLPQREAFFPSPAGGFAGPGYISQNFNRVWNAAKLKKPESGPQPRAYCFRHHFAYANIARWQEEGKDIEAMLPYLMHLMGHTTLESTYYYIHISPDFIVDFSRQAKATEMVLPEVSFYD